MEEDIGNKNGSRGEGSSAEIISGEESSTLTEKSEPEQKKSRKKFSLRGFFKAIGIPDMLLARFVGVYMLVSSLNLTNLVKANIDPIESPDGWKDFIGAVPVAETIFWIVAGFVVMTVIYCIMGEKYHFTDQYILAIGVMAFATNLMWGNDNIYLCIGVIAVTVVFFAYAVKKLDQDMIENVPDWIPIVLTVICAVAVGVFIAGCTIMRHRVFRSNCFDLGIFVQMFHSMVTDFTADTTCERDQLLSHFCVHSSFIYYLLAPVYAVFRNVDCLLISQAVLAMGGVVPFLFIARNHNYKGLSLFFAGLLYTSCAGIVAPCFFDFHENCFLPTLLMWLLYAVDTHKTLLFYIMSFLVCIVKEDAPLYVICIAVYMFFEEKDFSKRVHGIFMAVIAAGYFFFITSWLTVNGDGSMMASTRFGNLTIDSGEGFIGVIKNVLADPAYFFSLLITDGSLEFFLQVMLPLLFLPFLCKKLYRFLLILPFVIMNLVVGSDYGYATSINCQYIFGPAALLLYVTLLNCADFNRQKRNVFIASAAAASIIMTVSIVTWRSYYYEDYKKSEEQFIAMEKCISDVPKDAVIAAQSSVLPHCANRDEVYLLDKNDYEENPFDEKDKTLKDPDKYDFYILNYKDSYTKYTIPLIKDRGYTLYDEVEGRLAVYVSPGYEG